MISHTPGPWNVKWPDYDLAKELREEADDSVDDDDYEVAYRAASEASYAIISAPSWGQFAKVVVVVQGETDDAGVDNATLIAASPELLEACKAAMAFLDEKGYGGDIYRILKTAINKAEGMT